MPSLRPAARLLVALMLLAPAPAAAQSAGDDQYVDPFGPGQGAQDPPRPQPDPGSEAPRDESSGGDGSGVGGGGTPPSDPGSGDPASAGAPAGNASPGSAPAGRPGASADRLAEGLRRLEGEGPLPGLRTVAAPQPEVAVPAADVASESSPTPWIVVALAATAAIGGGLLVHRRRRAARTTSVGSPQPD